MFDVSPTRMFGVVVGLVPCLLGMALGTADAMRADMLVFNGICDASAGVALDQDHIIVGDDEKPWLSIYRLAGGDSDAKISFLHGPASAGAGEPEADLEGATVFDGRIVWISSNGRDRDGRVRPERFQLFASHRLSADHRQWSEAFSPSFRGLPEAIAATTGASYQRLRKSVGDLRTTDEDLAPKGLWSNLGDEGGGVSSVMVEVTDGRIRHGGGYRRWAAAARRDGRG